MRFKEFGLSLCEMILAASRNKKQHLDIRDIVSKESYLKDLCIVRMQLPRQCGNTIAVKQAYARFKANKSLKVLMLCPTKAYKKLHGADGVVSEFCKKPKDCDILFIDQFSHLSSRDINRLIEVCATMSLKENFIMAQVG